MGDGERAEAIASYDTIQVIAALLVGIGAALWSPPRPNTAPPVRAAWSAAVRGPPAARLCPPESGLGSGRR